MDVDGRMSSSPTPSATPNRSGGWGATRSAFGAVARANALKTIGTGLVGSVSDEQQARLKDSSSFAAVDGPEGEGLFGSIMKATWRRKVKRQGVPGGAPLDYGFKTICSWYGSSFQAALASVFTMCHIILFVVLVAASINLDFRLIVPSEHLGLMQFAAIFCLAFYSGQVLGRFSERFDSFSKTKDGITLITCTAAAHMRHEKSHAALLMRYANLIVNLNYLAANGPLDDPKWQLMLDRGLLTQFEKDQLVRMKKPSSAVFVWAVRVIHKLVKADKLALHAAYFFDSTLSTVHEHSTKQLLYQVTSIPKPYFHLMSLVTHVYLILELMSSSARVADAWSLVDEDESSPLSFVTQFIGTVLCILVLMAMWRTNIWLSDPVGDDVTDYDLDFDVRTMWSESLEMLKHMKAATDMDDLAERVLTQALSPALRRPAAIDGGSSTTPKASSVLTKLSLGTKTTLLEAGAALSKPIDAGRLTKASSVLTKLGKTTPIDG